MQERISKEEVARKLFEVYARLRNHFGYAHPWWPGTPFDIVVTSILVQQCDWSAAWRGMERLREHGIDSLAALAKARPARLQKCIHGVAFAPTKAARLVRLARTFLERGYEDIETLLAPSRDTGALREELLSVEGVGEETADCILAFASRHPAFVVDAYTRRLFRRLELFPVLGNDFWSGSYGRLQEFFESGVRDGISLYEKFRFTPAVPRESALFRDLHAQIVELGKHHCTKEKPRCHSGGKKGWNGYQHCESHCLENKCRCCPLLDICATGRSTLH